MLHAFNQKNARRVLASSGEEHTNDKNEDAITSMVFTPLVFMQPADALCILLEVIGKSLADAVGGRTAITHELQMWPTGLESASWAGFTSSRCEPDLVVSFEFDEGARVLVIGEMKWDWMVKIGHLQHETDRQRNALAAAMSDAEPVVFAITKFPLTGTLKGVTQRTWVQVHEAAIRLANHKSSSSVEKWGLLVAAFLEKAEQIAFQGFGSVDFSQVNLTTPLFWKEN